MEKGAYQPSPQALVVSLRQLYINEVLPDYRNQADSSIQAIQFDSVQAFENYPINPRIPSSQNHLGFQFSAIDWAAPTKIKYSFRLLGLDNKWSNPSAKTLADYRNLPHGKFIFQVRAIGENGKWSKAFEYTFTILPPWYRTWWAYTIYALLFLVALRTFSLWRERKLRKEKEQLQHKVEERTVELKQKSEQLEHSLTDLKSTQAQLIQSEKLASLGELTAGIAHEIQNPLNFVNNFSEMSVELLNELKSPLTPDGGIRDGEKVDMDLFEDVVVNLEKINHHGKRASSIVSGMLEHSKASTGERALTDINKLADEYLRLSYHGIRAKDNSFDSDYKTDFDENLPKIEVIPQDIGRVLLNLINNAFWAVKTVEKPLVVVKTEQTDKKLIIKVIDNGTGMSEATKAKIFQPFFTTKPTGQGTGLGLSLAYDIITKGHGGTIEVNSEEGAGTEFIVKLPII
jgi:C4-dicarboxylate-specific signal transduction histidine kinase